MGSGGLFNFYLHDGSMQWNPYICFSVSFHFLLCCVPDVLRYVHPLYQAGAVNATDWEAVRLAGIPARLISARAASTPVSPSWPRLSGWLPPLVLWFLPGPLRVSPCTYSSGEECWWCPVGAEHGEGEAEGKQPAGMSTLRHTNKIMCVALGYFHIMFWYSR